MIKSIFLNLINFRSFLNFNIFISIFSAIFDVPAFPGKQKIFFTNLDSDIFWHKACSRPPLPINPIFMINNLLYSLLMNKKKAKLIFKHNSFDVVEDGDFVICAVSGKEIRLQNLSYWNVDLQEAYFSPKEVKERLKNLKNK